MTRRTDPRRGGGGLPRAEREPADETAARPPSRGDAALASEIIRLTNRTAALTLAAAFACFAAFVAVARAFSGGTVLGRIAAAVLATATFVTVVAVWRSRVSLRAARGRADFEPGAGRADPRYP